MAAKLYAALGAIAVSVSAGASSFWRSGTDPALAVLQFGHATPSMVASLASCSSGSIACQRTCKSIYEGAIGTGNTGYFGVRFYDDDLYDPLTGNVDGDVVGFSAQGVLTVQGRIVPTVGVPAATHGTDYFISVSGVQGGTPTIIPVTPGAGGVLDFEFEVPESTTLPGVPASGFSFNIHVREDQDFLSGTPISQLSPEFVDIDLLSTEWTPLGGTGLPGQVGWNGRLRWIIEDSGQ